MKHRKELNDIQGIAKAPPPVVALIAALAALHPSHAGKRTIDEPTSNATRKGLRKHLLELQKAWFNPEVGSSQSVLNHDDDDDSARRHSRREMISSRNDGDSSDVLQLYRWFSTPR
jgi:hypothetical protein